MKCIFLDEKFRTYYCIICNSKAMAYVFQIDISEFLVRWLLQRTLVPSFFYLSSPFFQIFPFTCNFMWFIKLRASAGISGYVWGVCMCARVCASVRECAQVCMGVCRYARVCAGMHGCAWVCTSVPGCTQVCAGVHRCALVCAWICMGLRMYVGWIFRISSGE